MSIERRYLSQKFQVKKRADGGAMITGYPALFGVLSVNLGGFREKIERGAFANTIKTDDIRSLLNHDPNLILGRNKAGTARFAEDEVGLALEVDVPDTQAARDLVISLERGDIDQGSFGFRVNPKGDRWEEDPETGTVIRTLLDVKLYDAGPVTFPAYPQTSVGLRSLLNGAGAELNGNPGENQPAVSVETVYRALYRAEFGGLEDEDLQLLKALESSLRRLSLTGARQEPEPESDGRETGQAPDFLAMRRRLDLMAAEV